MSFVRSSYVLILGAAVCLAQHATSAANIAQTTGTVGLAAGQTARLNVVNPGAVPPATPTACTASLAFVNLFGAMIRLTNVSLAPGMSAFLDLHDSDLGLGAGDRAQIRGVVTTMVTASTGGTTACSLVPSLEIFDATSGRTLVVLTQTQTVP